LLFINKVVGIATLQIDC